MRERQGTDDGRKIPSEWENPLDNILIHVATFFNLNLLVPARVSPNMVTTISLICGLAAAYLIHISSFTYGAILFFIAYFFDCVDGNLARMTRMVTGFGDAFDHISDIIKLSAVTIAYVTNATISSTAKYIFSIGSGTLFLLMLVHFACQEERSSVGSSPFLKIVPKCYADIRWTRWLGSGTFIAFQTLMILVGRWSFTFKTSSSKLV